MSFDVATPATPKASVHLLEETWPDRGDPSIPVMEAWRAAEPIPTVLSELNDADEARYHQPTDTLLFRDFDTIVTAIDVTAARNAELRRTVYAAIATEEDSA